MSNYHQLYNDDGWITDDLLCWTRGGSADFDVSGVLSEIAAMSIYWSAMNFYMRKQIDSINRKRICPRHFSQFDNSLRFKKIYCCCWNVSKETYIMHVNVNLQVKLCYPEFNFRQNFWYETKNTWIEKNVLFCHVHSLKKSYRNGPMLRSYFINIIKWEIHC